MQSNRDKREFFLYQTPSRMSGSTKYVEEIAHESNAPVN
jgi:hypothetical protein